MLTMEWEARVRKSLGWTTANRQQDGLDVVYMEHLGAISDPF